MRVEIDSHEVIRLRELSRFQDELKAELRRATNRLWQQLHRYYPQMLAFIPAADDRLLWDLLAAAPTPAEGKKISSLRVQRILKANRIRKLSGDEVLSAWKTTPLVLAPGAGEAACEHVQLLLPQVKLLEEQLREVGNRIKRLLSAMTETNAGTDQSPCDGRRSDLNCSWRRSCGRRNSPHGSFETDPGTRLRGSALLGRHGPGHQAKRQEKKRRHASGLQSSLARRGVLLGNKQSLP